MDRALQLAHRVSRYGAWFGGGLILLSAFIVGVEVVIRKFFSMSIGGADELSGFALAIGSAWAFGFALLERAHIRIDSLYVWLPKRVCAVLDVIGLLVFVLFFGLLTLRGWGVFADTVELDARTMSPIATPLIYPQFVWVLGLSLLMVVAALLLVRSVMALVTGDIQTVQRIAGSKSASEELEEELRLEEDLRRRDKDAGIGRGEIP